jgi:heme oxygenase (mycobilin-producing)
VIALTRFHVPEAELPGFLADSRPALAALTAQAGCLSGSVARCVDDPGLWLLVTTWESVGAYRRALSAYDVKLNAVPLMYRAVDEPGGFEELLSWTPGTGTVDHPSELAG